MRDRNAAIVVVVIAVLVLGGAAYAFYDSGLIETKPIEQRDVTGRAVFLITDAAANMSSVSSVRMTVDSVAVHSNTEGWITVSSSPRTYDLLQLKAQGDQMVLADVELEEGTYQQIRMDVSNVVVTDAEGDHQATLPSGELMIVGDVVVEPNATATAEFDFIADESLHVTGNGEYVFAPVIQVETREDADVLISSNGEADVEGGDIRTNVRIGMDANGRVGVGLGISQDRQISIEGGRIRIGSVVSTTAG